MSVHSASSRRPDEHTPTRITHLLAGQAWEGTAERTSPVFNPATGEQTGVLDLASADLVGEVVADAKKAWQESWGNVSLTKRTQVLFRFRELLNERKEEIAALITAEHGKVLSDALGEVTRGLEVAEFACGIPHLLKGGYSENASTGVDVYSIRQSLGVVAVISPFNFPAMVPLWFIPVAIAAGNAVVLKPSEKDPSAALAIARLWTEAGLPDGIMNVVNGDKESVDALLTHPDITSVSFVGSTPIAKYVYETGTAHGKRVQALGGAKNHMIVLPDADLDLAADAAVNAGFGSAGERCMAISALVALEPIADELVEKIKDRMGKLVTGDGTRGCDMGPLVTAQHRDKVTSYLDAGVEAGATLVVDGREGDVDADGEGYFLRPTLFDHVTKEMSVYQDEIFGPVLSVIRAKTYDEALDLINSNPYGNGTAIFTNDGGAARRFQNEVEVGMIGVNVPIPVPMAYYSFGGWKNSLFGDTPRPRHGGRQLLHPRQGRHLPVARPQPRRPRAGLSAERLTFRRAPDPEPRHPHGGAGAVIWDFTGGVATSRHVPGVSFVGIVHPGLMGTAPSADLLARWNAREAAILGTLPESGYARVAAEAARTAPPRENGGDQDIKDFTKGSRVLYPVFVDGANLSMGDLHFSQGDVEVTFCGAIETGGFIDLRVDLIKGGMDTYGVSENAILMPGTTDPQFSEWLAFSGTSVTLDSCSTVYIPTSIFDIDVRPSSAGAPAGVPRDGGPQVILLTF